MVTKVTTERLSLNVLTTGDYAFILELVNSEGWLRFIGDRNIHTKEDAIVYINKILDSSTVYYWVVRLKETNAPIGIITFIKRDYLEYFDIGFAFLNEYTGKGFAYEAAVKVLSIVTAKPEHATVLATTKSDNVTSIKLLNKLGLVYDKEIEVGENKLLLFCTSNEVA